MAGAAINSGYGGQAAVTHVIAPPPRHTVRRSSKPHGVAGVRHVVVHQAVEQQRQPHGSPAAVAVGHGSASAGNAPGFVLQDAVLPFTIAALAVTLLLVATLRLLRKPPAERDDPMR